MIREAIARGGFTIKRGEGEMPSGRDLIEKVFDEMPSSLWTIVVSSSVKIKLHTAFEDMKEGFVPLDFDEICGREIEKSDNFMRETFGFFRRNNFELIVVTWTDRPISCPNTAYARIY